jgi:hypothetical protein
VVWPVLQWRGPGLDMPCVRRAGAGACAQVMAGRQPQGIYGVDFTGPWSGMLYRMLGHLAWTVLGSPLRGMQPACSSTICCTAAGAREAPGELQAAGGKAC